MKATLTALLLLLLCSPLLSAQEEVDDASTAERFKQGMMELAKRMIAVTEGVESVEDVEAAEPAIERAMERLVSLFTDLAENIDNIPVAELRKLQNMQSLMEDPEVVEWMDKAQAASDKLKARNPDAAARLEKIGNKHGEKMMGAMMGAMMKIGQKVGMGDPDEASDIEE